MQQHLSYPLKLLSRIILMGPDESRFNRTTLGVETSWQYSAPFHLVVASENHPLIAGIDARCGSFERCSTIFFER
jgi:hypothetical protein